MSHKFLHRKILNILFETWSHQIAVSKLNQTFISNNFQDVLLRQFFRYIPTKDVGHSLINLIFYQQSSGPLTKGSNIYFISVFKALNLEIMQSV